MAVMVPLVALLVGRVHGEVHGHAVTLGQLAGYAAQDFYPVGCIKLRRQGHFHFPADARFGFVGAVLITLGQLGRVPQRGAICGPHLGILGRHDFRVFNASAARVVVNLTRALVRNLRAGSIRSRRRGRMALGAAMNHYAAMIRNRGHLSFGAGFYGYRVEPCRTAKFGRRLNFA
ncbi:hypothetical protein R69746_07735 [Paraburkholderia aspalathi]|nr:hypothetical protein R69746_07735 [Paraburkholderia aspalathi]